MSESASVKDVVDLAIPCMRACVGYLWRLSVLSAEDHTISDGKC